MRIGTLLLWIGGVLSVCLLPQQAGAQGCSDAGVCTIGSLRSDAVGMHFKNEERSKLKHSLVFTPAIGLGEQSTVNFSPSIDLTLQVFDRFRLNAKTGFNITSGNLGLAYGASDVFVSGIIDLIKRDSINLSVVVGTKLSIQHADVAIGDRVLPLSYQSGVGTHDILFGVSFNVKSWYVGAGFQHSLTRSTSTFRYADYDSTSPARRYFEANRLQRRPDVVLRLEKKFLIKKIKLGLGVGAVLIYHLGNDTEIDSTGKRVVIDRSAGTTLNLTGNLSYKISEHLGLNLGVGFPVLVREVRPDGLTRSLVILPSITYSF